MSLITLTSDWGLRDYYSAAVKGYIITHAPGVNIIDVSHQITPFDIVHTSYIVKNLLPHGGDQEKTVVCKAVCIYIYYMYRTLREEGQQIFYNV